MNDQTNPPSELIDSLVEDLETQQNKIAEQLSELSSIDISPTGYKYVSDPFEPADVDFSSSGWLLRVLQIQAWLYPNEVVDARNAESDPIACASELFSAIGVDAANRCVEGVGGIVKLTLEGADNLAERLDIATRLQQSFTESVETLTRKQATAQWSEAWEEEEEFEAPDQEPIKATSDTWDISEFTYRARKGILNLNPSYQRGDVWPTSDAQKLIESILRGIPLPSIILLKPRSGIEKAQSPFEVVDGKQRLTSILRFIGQHPQAIDRVKKMDSVYPKANLLDLFQTDYKKFRRAWKNVVGESLTDKREAEYYFPFRLAQNSKALTGPLSGLAGKYYCEILEQTINVSEGHETVNEVFDRKSAYHVPVIEYSDASPKQIQEVFSLYNRQGKHLNAEEIRNALFHEIDLIRLLLAASGDNSNFENLAPYFPSDKRQLFVNISRCLDDYRFGSARYKRTKLLSWLVALLFQPAIKNGELTVLSTAKQIDALFKNMQEAANAGDTHRLADKDVLIQLIQDMDRCLEAHSSSDCWDSVFKDEDKGQKWQELQLVASLIAVFLIGVLEESPGDLLEQYRNELLEFTQGHRRPNNTQNKTQWGYVGEVALGIIDIVGINHELLEPALIKRFGISCVPTLSAAKIYYEPRSNN
jgi:hypothetical protein